MVAPPIIGREEKTEYRDENGNLLDEEQVEQLKGKVSFQTRYETRTRVVDAEGNEVADGENVVFAEQPSMGTSGAEGGNQETLQGKGQDEASDAPPTVPVGEEQKKEKVIEEKRTGTPEPASEPQEPTRKEEL